MLILQLAVQGQVKSSLKILNAHIIPNSHFGPGTDYQGFKGNLIGIDVC